MGFAPRFPRKNPRIGPSVMREVRHASEGRCCICITGVIQRDGYCNGCGNGPRAVAPSEFVVGRPLLVGCQHCAKPFHGVPARGRPKVFCSRECRNAVRGNHSKIAKARSARRQGA